MRRRPPWLCPMLAIALAACGGSEAPADWVLTNAAVRTMATPSHAEAIAVRGSRIVFVGPSAEAQRLVGEDTELIDLGGRMVLPGFHDTHVHPAGGISMGECNVDGLDRQAILDSVAACARAAPHSPWIRGRGWELPAFPGGNPRREWFDALVPDRPAWLEAADGHSAWVNSRALALAGITRDTPDPPNGRIERDPGTGEPSGTLRESAMTLVERHLPPYTAAERRAGLKRAMALANRLGITTLHDASTSPEMLETWAELDHAGELTARVVAAQTVSPSLGLEQVDSIVARRARHAGTRYFRPAAAKLFADGVIEAKTAALLAPYLGGDQAGEPTFRPAQLDSLVLALDAVGIQIHIHAIGDRAIRMGLDAIERAQAANGARDDRRPILAHIQLFDPADIPRFAALGVVASFQPLWAYADSYITDLTEPVLGPARSRWLYPIRSMVESGAVVAAGSDWTVSSMNPLDAIQVAVTRRGLADTTGPAWIPEEVTDLDTMLRAYTVSGAWAAGDEELTGTLEVGKAADLIVLDRDLASIPVGDIATSRVLLTLLDGREVFRDPALR